MRRCVCVHAPVCVCAFEISCSTLWEIAVFRCLLTNLQSEQIKQWCFSSAKTGLNMGVAALCDKRTSCNRLLFSLCSRAKLDKTGVIRENLLSLLNGWEIRPNDFLQLNTRIQGTILIAIIRTHTRTHTDREESNTFRGLLLRWLIHEPPEEQDKIFLKEAFHNKLLGSSAWINYRPN